MQPPLPGVERAHAATRGEPASVHAATLVWARTTAAYILDDVARRLRVAPARLAAWEAGAERPTVAQARALAELYHRPLTALYGPPRQEPGPPPDFRSAPGRAATMMTPALALDVRRARTRRDAILSLLDDRGDRPTPFAPNLSDSRDHAAVGRDLRAALGIALGTQRAWRSDAAAYAAWRDAAEAIGVLVFQMDRVERPPRAYSLHHSPLPIIVIAPSYIERARIFSLAHELVHLALGVEGLCDPLSPTTNKAERFADAAAAEMILPLVAVQDDLPPVPDLRDVDRYARRFHVSREVVARRFLEARAISQSEFNAMRAQVASDFRKRATQPKSSGGPRPSVKAWHTLGPTYISAVLDSYSDSRITLSDTLGYLGIRAKWLEGIQQRWTNWHTV
ncbi:MAG: ImmA/IrrE family metallo-endopeptidase [Armatimonadetes bacterium]|nr:ImmA/IrrE family metallo-endopeptidase [Armatimonadota bacterium]